MATLNPDFRGADEVVKPEGVTFGYSDGSLTESQCVDKESKGLERLANDMPVAFSKRFESAIVPGLLKKWNEFQASKGRSEGSFDWSLLDEFVFGVALVWLAQLIGSCVLSNSFRPWVTRLLYQIALKGDAMEHLGRKETGPQNIAFFGPWSYGMARRRAKMQGGDGLWCEPMLESYLKDGVLSCSTPALVEFMAAKGFTDPMHFPEPQGNSGVKLYREFGDWKYLDQFKQYADFQLLEGGVVQTFDDQLERHRQGQTAFVCSMIAIHKVGTHKDGFAIHARNPKDQWAHNMSFQGFFVASDGKLFVRMSNESWGAQHIYNVPADEASGWYRDRRVTVASIGQINGPASTLVAA